MFGGDDNDDPVSFFFSGDPLDEDCSRINRKERPQFHSLGRLADETERRAQPRTEGCQTLASAQLRSRASHSGDTNKENNTGRERSQNEILGRRNRGRNDATVSSHSQAENPGSENDIHQKATRLLSGAGFDTDHISRDATVKKNSAAGSRPQLSESPKSGGAQRVRRQSSHDVLVTQVDDVATFDASADASLSSRGRQRQRMQRNVHDDSDKSHPRNAMDAPCSGRNEFRPPARSISPTPTPSLRYGSERRMNAAGRAGANANQGTDASEVDTTGGGFRSQRVDGARGGKRKWIPGPAGDMQRAMMTRKNAGVIQLADDGTIVGVSRSGGGGATSPAEDDEEEEAEFEKGPWMAAMDALDAPTFDAGREANRVLSAPCDGICCDWGRL